MAWNDHSPVPPTCPKIDAALSLINSVYNSGCEMERAILDQIEQRIEEIRTHNSDLRTWGNEQWKEAERLEIENDNLRTKVERLEKEVDNLNDEVNALNLAL